MNQAVNVGLIGYGLGGRVFHAPIIVSVPGLNLYKVYETRPENIGHLLNKYKDVQVTANVNEILEDPNIQLVIVATPNIVHFELAKRAMENGKHVVVEKPFTVTSTEANQLIEIAKKTNKLLTVHHNRRWDSDFRTVEKVIKSNVLGDIVEYEAHYNRFRTELKDSWKEKKTPGTGIQYDLGSHLIDQAQCLFGLPEEVFGTMEIQRQGAITVDSFEIILRYPHLKVTLKSGMLVREAGPHFNIHGKKGSFVKYGMDIQEEELIKGFLPNEVMDWGKEPEALWGKINTEANGVHIIGKVESEAGDYREFYRNVYDALSGEAALAVTPEQARNNIRIIELAEQSSMEKRWIKYE
ncbi:MAG: Gfo/Idh/MocA family oxidoreductase [Clostridia bacterium]|nr:Gfo/Idh/MocA family oxidoreductase [Clostridia bacterium]